MAVQRLGEASCACASKVTTPITSPEYGFTLTPQPHVSFLAPSAALREHGDAACNQFLQGGTPMLIKLSGSSRT